MNRRAITDDQLAERLYRAQHDMARHYQFRSRDAKVCFGVTPTQCYALFELAESKRMTMADLARSVGLEPSSMTRAVDELVAANLVQRLVDPADRRRCLIALTTSGRSLQRRIFRSCVERELDVLGQIDASIRTEVVEAVELLAQRVRERASTGDVASPAEIAGA